MIQFTKIQYTMLQYTNTLSLTILYILHFRLKKGERLCSDLTLKEFFGTYTMFKILIQPDADTSYLSKILLLYGAKTNKTLV